MPTIPLYTSPNDPDESHHVRTPGGYEWWYFDAEDPSSDRQIFIIFFEGCPFDPRYDRAYRRYVRNPTRVRPPLPRAFPLTYFAMHQAGKVVERVIDRSPLPANTGDSLVRVERERFDVQLSFAPRWSHAAVEKMLLTDDRWIVGSVLCDVEGTIRLANDTFRFSGPGYRDHHWGTSAPSASIRSWTFGRQLHQDSVRAFHRLKPFEGVTQTLGVEVDAVGIRKLQAGSILDEWSSNPRLPRAHFYRRQVNDGVSNSVVHTIFPHLLGWPFVGQMIERKMKQGSSSRERV